jgi:hypothetical protein
MVPSQRTILLAMAAGAVGFVVLFALGVGWPLAVALGALLAMSAWFTLNYLAPTDKQSELKDNFDQIEKTATTIRALSQKVTDPATAAALQSGCDGVPRMIALIGQRDIAVALPLAERSRTYVATVATALKDYIAVQDNGDPEYGDPEYLQLGRQELKRFDQFCSQPDREMSEQHMNDYIDSVTALNMTPPPELS